MSEQRQRPKAILLSGGDVPDVRVQETPIPERAAPEPLDEAERETEAAQRAGLARRWRPGLATLVWTGLGGLVSLGFGLWVDNLLEAAWGKAQGLGWLGLVFLGLLLAGVLGLAAREFAALARQRRIVELRAELADAHARDDRDLARAAVARLAGLYLARPEMAAACAEVARASREIIDGRDLVLIAERALVKPLDLRARAEVDAAAKRVAAVTALSPRALFDVVFVAAQTVWLVRRIAEIYGGRPGWLGFFKLARSIGAQLAATGGMAAGDTIVQTFLGHGLAAKVSQRMGEGAINWLLTKRVGLSALRVCRPAPFLAGEAPNLPGFADLNRLFGGAKD